MKGAVYRAEYQGNPLAASLEDPKVGGFDRPEGLPTDVMQLQRPVGTNRVAGSDGTHEISRRPDENDRLEISALRGLGRLAFDRQHRDQCSIAEPRGGTVEDWDPRRTRR